MGLLLSANFAIGVLFVPQIPTLTEQLTVAGHRITAASLWSRFEPVSWVLSGFFLDEVLKLAALVAVLFILRWRLKVRAHPCETRTLLLSFGTVFVILGLGVLLSPLSLLLVAQCFAMLSPLLLVGVAILLQPGHRPGHAWGGLVSVILIAMSLYRTADLHRFVRSNGKEVANLLARSSRSGDLVLVFPAYAAPEVRRYGTAAGGSTPTRTVGSLRRQSSIVAWRGTSQLVLSERRSPRWIPSRGEGAGYGT